MSTTQPTILVTAQTSPKTALDFDTVFTLPYDHQDTQIDRTVMWHGPDLKGSGVRSTVPISAPVARAVTDGVPTPAGAALAGGAHEPATQALVRKNAESAYTVSLQTGDAKHGDVTATDSQTSQTIGTKTLPHWMDWHQRLKQVSANYRGPLATDLQAFDVLKLGREFEQIRKADRISRKDTVASETTIDVYRRKCKQIDEELQGTDLDDPDRLQRVMTRLAVKKQTFSLFKAALKWRVSASIQELLKSQNALQRAGDRSAKWFRHVDELLKVMQAFSKIDALDRSRCLEASGLVGKPGRSKRVDLPSLPERWQERFLKAIASNRTYGDAGVLLRFCGVRPVELAKGVKLTATPRGIEVRVLGGKVRETAGQPWRLLLLDPTALPQSFVHRVQIDGEITVTAEEGAMRAYLARLTQRVFQQGKYWVEDVPKTKHILSAYTLRHALVTDLRANGWDDKTIAGAIGESSAQTASYYGTRTHAPNSRTRKPAIAQSSVVCAIPVKPKDRQGLDLVRAKKSSANPKTTQLHLRPNL